MLKQLFFISIILVFIYLFLIMPKMFNRIDFTHFNDIYYAHRGLHQDMDMAPENSLAAFKLAVDSGYGIELDVQLSLDNIPVVFHDKDLRRLCKVDKEVKNLTFEELRTYTLNGSNEKIPHLQEVLDLVEGKVPLIVEFKTYTPDTSSCQVIAPYLDNYEGSYLIQSFNPFILKWYKKNRPNILRGQLATNRIIEVKGLKNSLLNFVTKNLMLNFLTQPDFIAYNNNYSHNFTYKLCRNLYKPLTIAYTIKSQERLDQKKNQFDLFIFESFTPK